jgi:NhaA family Na+:H+ antiporter
MFSKFEKPVKEMWETIRFPLERFLNVEASGGILLLFSTLVALFWANFISVESYHHFWHLKFSINVGNFTLSDTILHWINDGLMAVFFFVVGLEIKREFLSGELSSPKQAILPIMAAIGGMAVPALMFLLFEHPGIEKDGWGIPMATDIAFSLGVLSLLGKRVPLSLKVFLVAFAIVDDLGAVLIIALFYNSDVHGMFLLYASVLWLFLVLMNQFHVNWIPVYVFSGLIIWYLFYRSGVHPTIAGVLVAFTIPLYRKIKIKTFTRDMNNNLVPFSNPPGDRATLSSDQLESIDNMETRIRQVQSPLQSLEHTLHDFTTFVVMPLFALANAGVVFSGTGGVNIFTGLSSEITSSLFIGKVLGVTLFSWIAVKLGLAILPKNVNWVNVIGIGLLGGMGFTMSLFISNLAYGPGAMNDAAKIGILAGSFLAGLSGYLVLRVSLKKT